MFSVQKKARGWANHGHGFDDVWVLREMSVSAAIVTRCSGLKTTPVDRQCLSGHALDRTPRIRFG